MVGGGSSAMEQITAVGLMASRVFRQGNGEDERLASFTG